MSRIPDEVIEQVRDSADLIEIVGESVNLKRTGTDYRGPCPFHGGAHRNFAVIPKKGIYYCFVCHEGGDAFTFLMKRFGMDYPTAVREVARRVGISVPEQADRTGPDPREPLFSAVSAAQDYFAKALRESDDGRAAREYLAGRAWDLETVIPLGLGYAPRGGQFLEAMRALGIGEDVLVGAGLAIRRDEGGIYPRFRGRLMFPIHDLRGRVVAFGGRIIGKGEPKYLNSPESDIFHKGRQLYNLHVAKLAVRKADAVVVVEGYFDVLRLVQVGVEHVVAPLGTSLTDEQAAILKRFTTHAILLYDSDAAGLRATFRAADELLRHEFDVRVATLPPGEDPDTLAERGGPEAVATVLDDAVDVLERKIQMLQRKGWLEDVAGRRRAVDRLLPTIRAAASQITKELYLGRVAEVTGIAKEVLAREAAAVPRWGGGPGSPPRNRSARPSGRYGERAERDLLQVILSNQVLLGRAREQVPPGWIEGPEYREVFEALTAPEGDRYMGALPEHLSPPARQAWIRLKDTDEVDLADGDLTFAKAVEFLEARPQFRELERMPRLDGDELNLRRVELERDLQRRYPAEWDRWYKKRKYASGTSSSPA